MRVSHECYVRDLRRHNLALRMIGHGARNHTVRDWTALPTERIRMLAQSCAEHGANYGVRCRGPSPQRTSFFLKTARMRNEAAAITGICLTLEIIPRRRVANPRQELPCVERGERLCRAFELYRDAIVDSPLTLERVILLVMAVTSGDEIEVSRCAGCGALILLDRYEPGWRRCSWCADDEMTGALRRRPDHPGDAAYHRPRSTPTARQ